MKLTAPGRTLIRTLMPQVVDLWNDLLSDFDHGEVDNLIELLTRLSVAAEPT